MSAIPVFRIAILHEDTGVVAWSYGGGKLERELTAAVVEHLRTKRLGMLSSRGAIEAAVVEAIHTVCMGLKQQTAQVMAERYSAQLEETAARARAHSDLQAASLPLEPR